MEIFMKRETGFYGMASPMKIQVDDQKSIYLAHQQTRQLAIMGPDVKLQAGMFLLKSRTYHFQQVTPGTVFVVKMDPQRQKIYLALAILPILLSIFLQHFLITLIAIVIYFVFLAWMMQGIYTIEKEEDRHG